MYCIKNREISFNTITSHSSKHGYIWVHYPRTDFLLQVC